MENIDLTPEQFERAQFILAWMNRMNAQYGPFVHDKEGNRMEWGEAISRASYGEKWLDYVEKYNIIAPDKKAVERAKAWEEGDIPDWVVYQDTPVEEYFEYRWHDAEHTENKEYNE